MAMVQTKKALQEQVEKLEYENDQYRLACIYLAFDRDATRREKLGLKAQVILLREELADLKQKPREKEWFPPDDQNMSLEDGGLIG